MARDEIRDAFTRRSVIGGAAAAASLPALAQRSARRPNILFILADDLGYADLGCYGARGYATPALDGLAAQGLLMTQGYANSCVCTPTRVALITGRYQHRLRVGVEEPLITADLGIGLPPAHATLPSLLKARGYRTALVGKWHMGWPPQFGPQRSGYDRFFGIASPGTNYFTHSTRGRQVPAAERTAQGDRGEDAQYGALYEGETVVEREGYLTDLLADRAITDIRAGVAARTPFLVSLHFTAPHSPFQGPGEAALAGTDAIHDGTIAQYGAMVVALDAAIGRVLSALREAGAEQDTIVVFTSDNGGERYSDKWPLSGAKTQLLEGGIRVPLLVRWPGWIAPGSRSAQVMVSMDFLPTLLAAAGAATDRAAPPDGMNLLPVLTGAQPPVPRKLFWRFKTGNQAAVRDGDWKYLRRNDREFLFDIPADPRERVDRKAREPERFARMQQDFEAWEATMMAYPADSFSAGDRPDRPADQ